jgi:hypothetical protein
MSKHKKQHFIPSSYLEAWCDPNTPAGQTPYVWRFSKDGNQISKKAPQKIFYETDMYTRVTPEGDRDLYLEYTLSRVESEFAKMRTRKLGRKQKITSQEHLFLCVFVAAMFSRTKAYAKHQSGQWQNIVDMTEKIQAIMDKATPEERKQMSAALSSPLAKSERSFSIEKARELAEKPLQTMLSLNVAEIAPLLFERPYLILEAPIGNSFITSDDPCVWFDPASYQNPRPFGAGGLISPTLEITLPLSPKQMLFFGSKLIVSSLYFPVENEIVDNLNKRTRLFSDEFFVSNKPKVKP